MITRASVIEDLTKTLARIQYGDLDNVALSECEEAIINAIDLLREQGIGGWISVKDRLPANNSHVIVYDEGSKMVWPSHYMDATFYEENDLPYFSYHVNWWIPLPEPPEEVSGDD